MKSFDQLGALFLHFFLLSLIAVGGTSTTLPEMHRYLVDEQHWLTHDQFTSLYALSQASPGPNVLFVGLFGLQIAGPLGVIVSMLGTCGPAGLIALVFEIFSIKSSPGGWADILRKGLAPISVGMMCATGYVLAQGLHQNIAGMTLTLVSILAILKTKLHPLWLIALGASLGALGFV